MKVAWLGDITDGEDYTFLITAPVFRVKLVWSIYDVSLIIAFLFS